MFPADDYSIYDYVAEYLKTWPSIMPVVGPKEVWKTKTASWEIRVIIAQRWLR